MIKDIYIKNFKIFDEIHIEQLKTFNVIAGRNNYGKTTLLDSIFAFYGVKQPGILINVKGFRKDLAESNFEKPHWIDFFKDFDAKKNITIKIRDEKSTITQVYTTGETEKSKNTVSISLEEILSENSDLQRTADKESYSDTLNITVNETPNGKRNAVEKLYDISLQEKSRKITASVKQTKRGENHKFKTAAIITTSKKINKETTIANVSSIITKKKKNELIENLKIIDNRVQDVAIVNRGNVKDIYLDIGLSEMIDISLLGEGMSRLISLTSLCIEQKNAIILIGEIENGIHYSAIKSIIKSLIKISKANENQIFTTTHSNDVVKAINELDQEKPDVSYIRIDREIGSESPTAISFNMDEFSYSVENGWEVR